MNRDKPHIMLLPYKDTEYRWMCHVDGFMRVYVGFGKTPEEAYLAMRLDAGDSSYGD